MKRLAAYLLAMLALISCGNPQLWQAAVGEPIIPIRGDMSGVVLTDYLPSVDTTKIPAPVVNMDGGIGVM